MSFLESVRSGHVREEIEKKFGQWGEFTYDFRWQIIVVMSALMVVLFSNLKYIKFDSSMEGFFHDDDPTLLRYNDFRDQFGRDVVIDMYCYRKRGHNESDEPLATQPMMYKKIRDQKGPRRFYADQLVAEVPKEVQHGSRKITEWVLKPNRPDNHWFDCMVGCSVGAAMEGIVRPEWKPEQQVRRRRRRKATKI